MRRSASEIIRNLEMRIAKLERSVGKTANQSGSVSIRHKKLPYENPRRVLKRYTDDYDKVTAYYGFGPFWDERYEFEGLSEREEKRLLKDLESLPQTDEVSMFVRDDSEKGYRNIKASLERSALQVSRSTTTELSLRAMREIASELNCRLKDCYTQVLKEGYDRELDITYLLVYGENDDLRDRKSLFFVVADQDGVQAVEDFHKNERHMTKFFRDLVS